MNDCTYCLILYTVCCLELGDSAEDPDQRCLKYSPDPIGVAGGVQTVRMNTPFLLSKNFFTVSVKTSAINDSRFPC